MLTIQQYVKASSLEEAYELNQNMNNVILGGMLWLKTMNRRVVKAIDLSGLGLDYVAEDENGFTIGAMTSLRTLELHEGLNAFLHGEMKRSVEHIVGVQFRNMATIGGSIYGRYGFSDLLTLFLALDAKVKLVHRGWVSLRDFNREKPSRDVLEAILIEKKTVSCVYESIRNSQTDFPVLTCAVSKIDGVYTCVIGARPKKAMEVVDTQGILVDVNDSSIEAFCTKVQEEIDVEDNQRASKAYRKAMIKTLCSRAIKEIEGK